MRVELVLLDGARHAGSPDGREVIVAGASCPTCSTLDGVVDGAGKVVALAATSAGIRTALRDHPGSQVQPAHKAGPLRVYSDEEHTRERTIEGRALCARCRRPIGVLVVHTNTMFGHTEDDAVQARARVY